MGGLNLSGIRNFSFIFLDRVYPCQFCKIMINIDKCVIVSSILLGLNSETGSANKMKYSLSHMFESLVLFTKR